jgi:hypothetical protein
MESNRRILLAASLSAAALFARPDTVQADLERLNCQEIGLMFPSTGGALSLRYSRSRFESQVTRVALSQSMLERQIRNRDQARTREGNSFLLSPPAEQSQEQPPPTTRDLPRLSADFRGEIAADFNARLSSYFELRKELEKGLPARRVTNDPAEIKRTMLALAERIRVARAHSKLGDFFTPPIRAAFRKALRVELDSEGRAAIMDDNPGKFAFQVYSSYPDRKALSTVPPSVLAVLPQLPDDIQYRFLGRDLILFDTRAGIILDRVPLAIRLH